MQHEDVQSPSHIVKSLLNPYLSYLFFITLQVAGDCGGVISSNIHYKGTQDMVWLSFNTQPHFLGKMKPLLWARYIKETLAFVVLLNFFLFFLSQMAQAKPNRAMKWNCICYIELGEPDLRLAFNKVCKSMIPVMVVWTLGHRISNRICMFNDHWWSNHFNRLNLSS